MNVTFEQSSSSIWVGVIAEGVFNVEQTIELENLGLDPNEEVYTFEVRDFFVQDYANTVPKSEAETNNSIDPGKVLLWLLKKLRESICPECQ